MRTTVDLSEDLLQEAKLRAARRRITVSAVIEDAIRASFARDVAAARNVVTLPTDSGMGGLRPGINLDDNASVLEVMEDFS
ncbi:ribbon-helix-helix domain-containing protein [Streptomyces sp. A3M-1-3]|uniref:ribbon-helix-helix domain-containing protein n=1 Tax=Streptomyces sp. A3M-1-3 TaxID=2962044 RepID=UPI0020B6FCE6|nr:CopG family transcriptional regulator [Streptomyces sp. A3M-1-3]MCP3822496.1 ribbon-helix-helix domain-containing protein [Streptomyces sp. A3M-1-3]